MIHTAHFGDETFEYVWAVPQSRLAAVVHYDPISAELPISPHQAMVIATEFIKTQFPASTQLRPDGCTILARGIEKNPLAGQVWMYDVSFYPDPLPEPFQSDLLSVMVLMDGKVVAPVKRPWTPRK
ncbi:MAG: hypothetical protein QOH88_2499 [Verrucomicrobiota bacterium]